MPLGEIRPRHITVLRQPTRSGGLVPSMRTPGRTFFWTVDLLGSRRTLGQRGERKRRSGQTHEKTDSVGADTLASLSGSFGPVVPGTPI